MQHAICVLQILKGWGLALGIKSSEVRTRIMKSDKYSH